MSLKEFKSQGKAVKMTVNSKGETLMACVWISSKNTASVPHPCKAFINAFGATVNILYV